MNRDSLIPVVTARDGTAVADSRDIAAAFGKLHKDVLRKIDTLIGGAPDLRGCNFTPTFIPVDGPNGATRQERAFAMDRKGFSLLAMRFTGAKALEWQIAYVDEFDRMEAALRASAATPIGDQRGALDLDAFAGRQIVDGFGPAARSTLGGIMKRVTHAELQQVVGQLLPALAQPLIDQLVQQSLTSHRYQVVEGVSALEVADMIGFTRGKRPKGASQFISRRLTRFHEDRGIGIRRSVHGSGQVKLFDEVATRAWISAGGRGETEQYIAERRGQGRLTLVR